MTQDSNSDRRDSGDRSPSAQSLRGLDGLNFLMADVRDGLGPYLSVFLKGGEGWQPAGIGVAMAASSIAAACFQIPAGLMVDSLKWKRTLVAVSGLLVAAGCLVIAFFPKLGPVVAAQIMLGAASAIIPPAIAALSLGLVGRRKLDARVSRNEGFNHAGNFVAAALVGGIGGRFGYQWIFYLVCAFAVASAAVVLLIRPSEINHELARGGESPDRDCKPIPYRDLLKRRDLMIFLASVVLFHFGNAAMLPMAGQVLAQKHPGTDTISLSACIIAAQLVMVGVAWAVGRAMTTGVGRKPIFLVALAVLPVRGLLFSFVDFPLGVIAIQLLDGVAAGIFRRNCGRHRLRPHARDRTLQPLSGVDRALRRRRGRTFEPRVRLRRAGLRLPRRLPVARADRALRLRLLRRPDARDRTKPPRSSEHVGHGVARWDASRGRVVMFDFVLPDYATWAIAFFSTAGVIIRPFNWPEAVWAGLGAALIVALRLLSPSEALAGVEKGTDVYLFLVGMMLLSETARQNGLFDWLAARASRRARGSARRLFLLVYAVGAIVTVFLSNDATAVVLTPAVAAAAKTAKAKKPLPFLFACALIANAASFVLPISNPANLVIYGAHMPPLLIWMKLYLAASVVSIAVTYACLRWTQRSALDETIAEDVKTSPLPLGGGVAAIGIAATVVVLLFSSAFSLSLGLPTCIAGVATTAMALIRTRTNPVSILKTVSWGVLPLVAGLFVVVEALDKSGVIRQLASLLQTGVDMFKTMSAWTSGLGLGAAVNLMNNLPAGLIAGSAVKMTGAPESVRSAVLIGVDLGPNLSVTGSLATIFSGSLRFVVKAITSVPCPF